MMCHWCHGSFQRQGFVRCEMSREDNPLLAQACCCDDVWHLFRRDMNLSVAFSAAWLPQLPKQKVYLCLSCPAWGIKWARRDKRGGGGGGEWGGAQNRLLTASETTTVFIGWHGSRQSALITRQRLSCLRKLLSDHILFILVLSWIGYKKSPPRFWTCCEIQRERRQGLSQASHQRSEPFKQDIMISVHWQPPF